MAISRLQKPGLSGLLAALLAASLLGACASRPAEEGPQAAADEDAARDPYESFNRTMWDVNMALDKAILQPVTWLYRQIFPGPLRDVFTNVASNAETPVTIVNSVLQGKFDRAGTASTRLLVNTTVGVAGIADPASAWGIAKFQEDFGQTLAVWGVGGKPYLVLPIVGPTNPRDAIGFGVDSAMGPVDLGLTIADKDDTNLGWSIGGLIETRDRNWQRLKQVRSARDPYVFARSAFRQNRRFEIYDGNPPQSEREEDLFEQDFEAGAAGADDETAEAGEAGARKARQSAQREAVRRDRIERILLGPDFRLRASDGEQARQAPRPSGPGFSLR